MRSWRHLLTSAGLPVGPAELPPRVETMLRESQARAEVLIGFVQVTAILTFAVLYAISRAANPPPMEIEPIPVALGLYAGFTALRLWLAWRRQLTRGLLVASVVVDIAVLMVTIWSFHLQYMAPAAISLKAPTLMYVFILIALRTLRLEVGYVLIAGATAVTGWAVLAGYVLLADPPARVTRSFLDYVTSPAVLLGAEFDKVVSIGMVTAILALSVLQGRGLLLDAAREQVAAAELSRFFPPEVAVRIRTSKDRLMVGAAERREAAILVTDLRGFTRLARELPPRELLQRLAEYQQLVVAVIRAHGGSVDKYLGDGVLASFGAVRPGGPFAADALRAVEEIVSALAGWNASRPEGSPPLAVGLAVAVGEILFGVVGHAERLEYTVLGDPVNLAAKLEKHNKAEASRALADPACWALAAEQGFRPNLAWEERPAREVAGVDARMDLRLLTGAGA
ncbi:adenylate/guanylate cyclase domain-containing protein [Sabulicella rubraurantiaca]|uniref:adenylate/guanylate cyclase domain-containing protein n=1 Tax=Sabulicella rubraurantiaca TaxID=2811429 RepID=UPI001A970BF3|nr:adenylate/guanylate cyclase domain-containing protein [Sabulicella rubraurantiaca]